MKIVELRKKLTLEEKIGMIHGAGLFRTEGVERLSIPPLKMSDGPSGVRQDFKNDEWIPIDDGSDFVSWLPSNTCLASTWNKKRAYDFGKVLGEETRGRGKDVILAPGINIKRTPLCGRNFEYMSEDPYLTSEIAVAEIQAIQKSDVAACVKHFALNNQEHERMSVEAKVDERTLREIYLPAFFAAAIRADSYSIMGAYNQFEGEHCCHNKRLLQTILRDEWGYSGVTISDWGGVHDTKEAALNGLDIEMSVTNNFNEYFMADPLYQMIKNGEIPESVVDEKVDRILQMMSRLHMFSPKRKSGSYNTVLHHHLIQKIAEEGIVLLKNDTHHLPLSKKKTRIAVIGDNATRCHSNGGGSAEIKSLFQISPLLGIKMYLGGNAEVEYAPGYYIDNENKVVGEVDWQAESLSVDYDTPENRELFEEKVLPQQKAFATEALKLAKNCDEVIFVGGLNHAYDVEGFDRSDMKLPYGQDSLIEQLLDICPEMTVVLISGAPVELPWLSRVHSLIQTSYPGMMGGTALAKILFGEISPSGHLAETWPLALTDCPAHKDSKSYPGILTEGSSHRTATYSEGIFVGYRHYLTENKKTAFPFGHGLSYTSFQYKNLKIKKKKKKKDFEVKLTFKIRNTGNMDAKETAQIYVQENEPSVPRPLRELRAFKKILIRAGEEKKISITLSKKDFSYYDTEKNSFCYNEGAYTISIGRSCEDIQLSKIFTLK